MTTTTPTTPHEEPPRRLRATDVIATLETALANVTTRSPAEPTAAVELSRNAKGDAQFVVKVSAGASATHESVRHAVTVAIDEAVTAFDTLDARYPHTERHVPENDKAARAAAAIARNARRGDS